MVGGGVGDGANEGGDSGRTGSGMCGIAVRLDGRKSSKPLGK